MSLAAGTSMAAGATAALTLAAGLWVATRGTPLSLTLVGVVYEVTAAVLVKTVLTLTVAGTSIV